METRMHEPSEINKPSTQDVSGFDPDKRIDVSHKHDSEPSKEYDPDKRVEVKQSPDQSSDANRESSDLTSEQKQELSSIGMSQSYIEKCSYEGDTYKLKTFNENLAGSTHPQTGVEFVKKTVEILGVKIEGVFPKFDSQFTAQLPKEMARATDKVQFDECTKQLKEALSKDSSLADKFTPRQVAQINDGNTPSGYVWNHNEELGKLELVDSKVHNKTEHTGGRAIWGGGTAARK